MKHCHPVIILICALTFTNAMALDSGNITANICTPAGECRGGPYTMTGCDTVTCTRYKVGNQSSIPGVEQITTEITSCQKCLDGYTRTSKSEQCGTSTVIAYTCVKNTCTCPTCPTITDEDSTGYIRTQTRTCNRNEGCICEVTSTKYSCASGYYQSGNTVTCTPKCSGCSECPANSTCNTTGFTCNSGYYESGGACKKCPANSTCNTTGFTCKDGYYESGGACQECPANSTCNATGFTCNSGYYESGSACKKCPDNSTCESDTNFTCKDGYYKSGGACQKCPDNSTCSGATFTCNQNYYRHNNACVSCGTIKIDNGDNQTEITMVTDAAGAKNKSACHLPDDVANTTYNTKYNGHNVTVRLTGSCSKN